MNVIEIEYIWEVGVSYLFKKEIFYFLFYFFVVVFVLVCYVGTRWVLNPRSRPPPKPYKGRRC